MAKLTRVAGRVIDLTRPLRPDDPVYPGDPPLRFDQHRVLEASGYRLTRLTLGTHCGTHVDAPSHYLPDGPTVDMLPLESLIGRAVVLDMPGRPRAVIEPDDLARFERLFQPGARVLLRTGWEARYGGQDYYTDHPGLSAAAARWIAGRRVALLGFDTPSPSLDTQVVHRILLADSVALVIVESLVNLHSLPDEFTLVVLPLKLTGLDGSPVRAIAVTDR